MTIEESADRIDTLLHWLQQRHPETPRKRAKQWIQAGRVSVRGKIIRQPNQTMPDPRETLVLLDRSASALDCGAGWQIHPRVALLYLDSNLAILNKAPGLLAVPAPNSDLSALGILADLLAGQLKAPTRGVLGRSLPPAYQRLQPQPVHRLDQYTSGVFCVALNAAARHHLIDQLKAHTMGREYVAYVDGRIAVAQGTWRHWLQFCEDDLRQHVLSETEAKTAIPQAVEAITHYEVLAEFPLPGAQGSVTKLRLRLETGRQHQIRAQAAHAGVPLLGDRTYHPRYRDKAHGAPAIPFPRQALHAESLSLAHPDPPNQRMTWTAPLPQDLRQLETALHRSPRDIRHPPRLSGYRTDAL
jgi:23S rRNA pseudouridine1911/1915/1917 synthase